LIADGWVDWAIRLPSHPQKVYSQPNSGEWITVHSVVGTLKTGQVPARFLSDDRVIGDPARFTDNAAASVMFILYEDGTLGQCYPVTASTWTSGGREANTRSWAIEASGGGKPNYGEKLTRPAADTFIRLVREYETFTGRKAVIKQHKDVAAEFGYDATACASDRYSEAVARLAEPETKLLDEQRVREIAGEVAGQSFLALLAQAIGVDESTFTDDAKVQQIRTALKPNLTVYQDIANAASQFVKAVEAAARARK